MNLDMLPEITEKFEFTENSYRKYFKYLWNLLETKGSEGKSGRLSEAISFEKAVILAACLCITYDAFERFMWDVEACISKSNNPRRIKLSAFENTHPEFYRIKCISVLKEMRDIRELCKVGYGTSLHDTFRKRPDIFAKIARDESYWPYDLRLKWEDLEKYFTAVQEFSQKVKEAWLIRSK